MAVSITGAAFKEGSGLGLIEGKFRVDMIIRIMWLIPYIGGPCLGCPCSKTL